MRWSCPHCGVNLAISDDKIGSGWSFSRCYKCAGYALVRRADISLIKVDKAPVGEPVILPEGSEEPMMSQEATKNLSRYLADKPIIRPAIRRTGAATQVAATSPQAQNSIARIPEPLPEISGEPKNWIKTLIRMAIGTAGMVAIGSGIYLYTQGEALWEKARSAPARSVAVADPQPEPEIIRAPALLPRAEMIDEVHHDAMAPVRPIDPVAFTIQPKQVGVHMHAGPGVDYPVIGTASPTARYVVADWNERWFKVMVKNANGDTVPAWVRNDLVQPLSSTPQ